MRPLVALHRQVGDEVLLSFYRCRAIVQRRDRGNERRIKREEDKGHNSRKALRRMKCVVPLSHIACGHRRTQ